MLCKRDMGVLHDINFTTVFSLVSEKIDGPLEPNMLKDDLKLETVEITRIVFRKQQGKI